MNLKEKKSHKKKLLERIIGKWNNWVAASPYTVVDSLLKE